MKLTRLAVFAVGYVVGARAGRERYAQIVELVERTSERLDEFSARHDPVRDEDGPGRGHGDSRRQETPL